MSNNPDERIDLQVVAGSTRAERALAASLEHGRRMAVARDIADRFGGVVTRAHLLDAGITSGQIRSEVERGAWRRVGRHVLGLTGEELSDTAAWWRALWETGPRVGGHEKLPVGGQGTARWWP